VAVLCIVLLVAATGQQQEEFRRCDRLWDLYVMAHIESEVAWLQSTASQTRFLAALGFEMTDVATSMGEQSREATDAIRLAIERRDLMREVLETSARCRQDAQFLESMGWQRNVR